MSCASRDKLSGSIRLANLPLLRLPNCYRMTTVHVLLHLELLPLNVGPTGSIDLSEYQSKPKQVLSNQTTHIDLHVMTLV